MRLWGLALVLVIAACGDDNPAHVDAPPTDELGDAADAWRMPATLADTGLCLDAGCTQIMPDAHLYQPQFALYADGATKLRWIYLPPGSQIDNSDPNFWIFPVGTRLWKDFASNGTRVETRYMVKLLDDDATPGSWLFASFEWNATQDATTLAPPATGVQNANGTQHDIPSRQQCRRCHENSPGRVLGFGAISLDWTAPSGSLDLDGASALGMLMAAPPGAASPHYPLPGAAVDKTFLGYVHANCGHCHNPRSSIHDTTLLELRLDTTKLATLATTPAYLTTVNVNGTVGGLIGPIITPNDATNSVIITRFTATTSPPKMPELGTESTDPVGEAAIRAWIASLP